MPKRKPSREMTNDPLRRPTRPGLTQLTAPTSRKPGPAPKRGKPFREALPAQIAARVTVDTFQQYEALRLTLTTSNTELLEKGAALIIENLTTEQRKEYGFFIGRIQKRTT